MKIVLRHQLEPIKRPKDPSNMVKKVKTIRDLDREIYLLGLCLVLASVVCLGVVIYVSGTNFQTAYALAGSGHVSSEAYLALLRPLKLCAFLLMPAIGISCLGLGIILILNIRARRKSLTTEDGTTTAVRRNTVSSISSGMDSLDISLSHPVLLHVLIRKISPYTGADILLGVFSTEGDAERARDGYFKKYSTDPSADPWREQAYRSAGLKTDDLEIVPINAPTSLRNGDEAIVVSNYEEMFGQIVRTLDSLHLSEANAQSRIAKLEEASDGSSYALPQRILVGVLQSDHPEQQPHF